MPSTVQAAWRCSLTCVVCVWAAHSQASDSPEVAFKQQFVRDAGKAGRVALARLITATVDRLHEQRNRAHTVRDLRTLCELLEDESRADSGDSTLPSTLAVRDVALTVIDALCLHHSPAFAAAKGNHLAVKCIVAHRDPEADVAVRYHIADIPNAQFGKVCEAARYWLAGCEAFHDMARPSSRPS